ncbi:MAG: adenylosuccinate lyase [Caldilineales bacterium]|nr:adenylosuccinate lyase [Caldilineales bacterium]
MTDHTLYQSPFTWRYGCDEMRQIFSEEHRRRLWRRVWVALARAQAGAGLVSPAQLADIEAHAGQIDIERALEIERVTRHDVMAEIMTFAEQCAVGGGVIHLGATSMDVVDNAEALRQREALDLLLAKLRGLIERFADLTAQHADTPTLAYTHLQPAEPTTLGYRFAQTLQDLLIDWEEIARVRAHLRGKGLKGAVGTLAAFSQLLEGTGVSAGELERRALADLGLDAFPATTQTYPRKQDWLLLNALAGLAGTLYRFAFDLRLLQSPPFGELSEPFGAGQVGSSAMPFKRNPITAEKIDSLARHIAALPHVAWQNAAHTLLERTLDDSANRRSLIPEAFLAADELLISATRILGDLHIWPGAIARNLRAYGIFAASERLLMEAVKAGGDRQHLHEVIRRHSLAAWAAVQAGAANPLADLLAAEPAFTRLLAPDRILALLDASAYVGEAPQRARAVAAQAKEALYLLSIPGMAESIRKGMATPVDECHQEPDW